MAVRWRVENDSLRKADGTAQAAQEHQPPRPPR